MDWERKQIEELNAVKNTASKCHIRLKALAVWNISRGKTYREVADYLGVCRQSVSNWTNAYREYGCDGWYHQEGQGKKSAIDLDDIIDYLTKSPREFGVNRTRWTLDLLISKVPCLKGVTRGGLSKFFKRNGISYKRGQSYIRSPDPDYIKKKAE